MWGGGGGVKNDPKKSDIIYACSLSIYVFDLGLTQKSEKAAEGLRIKLYIPNTINTDYILWQLQLIVAV